MTARGSFGNGRHWCVRREAFGDEAQALRAVHGLASLCAREVDADTATVSANNWSEPGILIVFAHGRVTDAFAIL
jgi:hypothetical protein